MSQRRLLRTRERGRAAYVINKIAEPFNFDWERKQITGDIQVTGAELERIKIFGVSHGAPVLVRSSPLSSYCIVLPLQGKVIGKISQVEHHATSGEALVFPAGTCSHAHWDKQCIALVLSIKKEEFDVELDRVSTANDLTLLPPKLNLLEGVGRSFLNILSCLCADCDLQEDGSSAPLVSQSLQRALLVSLLQMSAESDFFNPEIERASTHRRRAGVARAVDYLQLNMHRKVDIDELSQQAYLSLRSLQMGFIECFGMGPMTYSKRLRLIKAREELKNADHRYTNVAQVAERWGFQCGNTFRRLYMRNYGELPSQTLKQTKENDSPTIGVLKI